MFASRNNEIGQWGTHLLLGLVLVGMGCSQPTRDRHRTTDRDRDSPRVIRKGDDQSKQDVAQGEFEGTELWFFGITEPELAEPFAGRGARLIMDLRSTKSDQAIALLDTMADHDLGVAICLRWKNPNHEGDRPRGRDNFDVPPTDKEADQALEQIRQILSSEPAERIGDSLYIEIYNEIGGGPGRFALEDMDEMMAFADRIVPVIRSTNSKVKICGPAISGGQLSLYGEELSEAHQVKAEVLNRWIEWTVKNADVQDVHLNGHDVDADWADQMLTDMRTILDDHGGEHIGLVSLEWSCSGYSNPNDEAGTREYIHGVWEAMNEHQVQVAAYTYWPLLKREAEVRDKTDWASVMGQDKRPNQVVWETLTEVGHDR